MSICCLNLCTSSRSSSRDGLESDWVVFTARAPMGCFRLVEIVEAVGAGKVGYVNQDTHRRGFVLPRVVAEEAVISLSSHDWNSSIWDRFCTPPGRRLDTAREGHCDHLPASALLTGAAKNCGVCERPYDS
jgi:hypothetical protein